VSTTQDIDCPDDIESLTRAGSSAAGLHALAGTGKTPGRQPFRVTKAGSWRRWLHSDTVRSPERQRSVVVPGDMESFLMYRTMVSTAQENEVVERRRAAGGPVHDVMTVTPARRAARELAPRVAGRERPADRGGDRTGLAADIEHRAVRPVAHHDHECVARQPLRRFGGNVDRGVVQFHHRMAGMRRRFDERLSLDMDDDLIPVAGCSAPASGVRRPRTTSMPSSSTESERHRCR
jgi:hypothetical protein